MSTRFATARRYISAILAALLVSTLAVQFAPADPAMAALGDTGGLTISKLVDTQPAITGVEPGETFTYDIVVGCDDNDCINATLIDELPDEFAGFTLSSVSVSPANPTDFSLLINGGCAENAALTTGCTLEVGFKQPLGDLAGVPQYGIVAGTTFRISYTLTAPLTLLPGWAYDGVAVPNVAEITATNAATRSSSAEVTVEIPIVVDATVTKTWTPSPQQYGPGTSSTVMTGIANASNVPADLLVLQDPSIAVDGAASLPNTNPFTRVNFGGLCGVTMPGGADRVQVDVYYQDALGVWSWVLGVSAATATLPAAVTDNSRVGGLRLTYSSTAGSTIAVGGAAGSLCFTTQQRTTHRTTGAALVTGGSIANEVAGFVRVPSRPIVRKTATASLDVTGLTVAVSAGKQITPERIPASGEFLVAVSGKNDSNGTLSSLTISEPGSGTFLSDELIFTGFTTHTWPTGATAASFVWHLNTGSLAAIPLTSASPAPAAPLLGVGEYVTGFDVTYTGAIIAGTTAGWSFAVDTVATMIPAIEVSELFTNTVGVSGTNAAGTDTDSASDDVRVFYPNIDINLTKSLSPDLNTPGGTAVLSLETVTSAESQYVRPTKIVVEDVWDGTAATSFWDSHRAQEIVFTDVPAGSLLVVEYATGTPPALTWTELTPPGGASTIINSLAVPSSAVGLRFTYTNASGFGQGTTVKPNIVFQAAATLRSNGAPTDVTGAPATRYYNQASSNASGMADALPVVSPTVTDNDQTDIIIFGGGTGPGPGTMLASKRWVGSNWSSNVTNLNSQSGVTARTLLGWGVTTPGYSQAVISDAVAGSETTPATTTFQAFDLTAVSPISYTLDPLLRWDVVSSVELYMSGAWQTVTPPAGGWMNATGFRGHTLTSAQVAATTGVRITVIENTAARTASTDPTRPAPGSGVAWSATERPIRLQWSLRNTLRVPISPTLKWATQDVAYNLAGNGVIRNAFGLDATYGGVVYSDSASDDVSLIDTTPNLNTRKSASTPWVTVPYFGDVALNDYPTVDFTVEVWNTASARASYLRSADPFPCPAPLSCITPANNFSPDIYTSKSYDALTNPFERFNLTQLTFVTPAAMNVDRDASQVALWRRDAAGVLTVDQLSITAATALTAAQLDTVVGVSVVYQSTDPVTTGGLIPAQNATATHLSMTLHTRLRATLRSNTATLVTSGIIVGNTTHAQSFDPVLTPTGAASTPNASTQASVQLRAAALNVTASKSITPGTIIEANPTTPITVSLGATSGTSTLGAQTATIRDIDPDFWGKFRITGLGAVTLPAVDTRVRVDVQLNGGATWVIGVPGATAVLPASVTNLAEVTGIQFVFDRADGGPFSATVPSADWSASSVFTAVLRTGVTFPGAVNNAIETIATHDDYPAQNAAASDDVILSNGTARMDVRKEALTGNVTHITEPGVDVPWTLEFTNSGTGYLDVTSVLDTYDTYLEWDGSTPTYSTSAGGTLPTTGILVTQPTPKQLAFTWPGAARMQPGEKFVITLKLSLLPGLTALQRATNSFTVNTVQTLTACTNTSGNGQGILAGLGGTQCGTSNYVQPLAGALLFAQKSVKGEVDGTLVDGAVNIQDPALPCTPDSAGFFHTRCVALTAVGATDTWRLVATNSGTIGYTSVTLVDVLPNIGDRLLATGANRGSAFRPVLKDVAAPGMQSIPAGATTTWEVSTDATACVGAGPGSDWSTNPTCSTTTWVAGATFAGLPETITAVRWTVNFAGTATGLLPPGGSVELRLNTVNAPLVTPNAISVVVPVGNQYAWNQFGVVATPETGAQIRRAPVQVGVVARPATLQVEKVVDGDAASYAPANFSVTLVCSVPDGAGGTASVDMGAFRTLSVPANGSSQVAGIPLGAECEVDGEPMTGGATNSDLGTAVLLDDVAVPGEITVTNTFEGGPLDIIKNRVGVAVLTHGAGPFRVQVVCGWAPDGVATPIALPGGGSLVLSAGNGYRAQLPVMPVGTSCKVDEVDAGNATATTLNPVSGVISIVQPGVLVPAAAVTITNVFDSSLLASTGLDTALVWLLLTVAALLVLLGLLAARGAGRRRRAE